MKNNWLERTELLLGKEKLKLLKTSHVLIAGLGGVGGYAAEQLCRAGIGKLTLIDSDCVHYTNRNRQIIALISTEGEAKIDLFRKRLLDINPDLDLTVKKVYLSEENVEETLKPNPDYLVDAIDTLTPKVQLLSAAHKANIPVISSMGSGGKMDPLKIQVSDIQDSNHCKFAFYVRKYLRRLNIHEGIKVVYSAEPVPKSSVIVIDDEIYKRSIVGTISYMPSVFGCICASVVIRYLIDKK